MKRKKSERERDRETKKDKTIFRTEMCRHFLFIYKEYF